MITNCLLCGRERKGYFSHKRKQGESSLSYWLTDWALINNLTDTIDHKFTICPVCRTNKKIIAILVALMTRKVSYDEMVKFMVSMTKAKEKVFELETKIVRFYPDGLTIKRGNSTTYEMWLMVMDLKGKLKRFIETFDLYEMFAFIMLLGGLLIIIDSEINNPFIKDIGLTCIYLGFALFLTYYFIFDRGSWE